MITLENKKLHDLISEKDELVNGGRKISMEIEKLQFKIKRCEDKEKRITGKVIPPKELTDKGEELVKQIKSIDEELAKIIKKINDYKLEAVPKDLKDEHHLLMKNVEELERDRNKVALKVQKIKDKIIPIIQREVKPLLQDTFDDIETAKIKDGKIQITTFNHVEEFKKRFKK